MNGDPRDLPVLTPPFPTRRSSDPTGRAKKLSRRWGSTPPGSCARSRNVCVLAISMTPRAAASATRADSARHWANTSATLVVREVERSSSVGTLSEPGELVAQLHHLTDDQQARPLHLGLDHALWQRCARAGQHALLRRGSGPDHRGRPAGDRKSG